ncbi:MAG: L,D-transpeptidase [Bacillota bacterium]
MRRAVAGVLIVIITFISADASCVIARENPFSVELEDDASFLPVGYPEHGILINIAARRLVVIDHGRIAGSYPVAVGRPDSPSPVGDFWIATRIWQPWWYPRGREPVPSGPDNPLGPWWLGLNLNGYGIHGNNNENSIGQFISDGCIRMNNDDVSELARWVETGTPVRMVYDTVALLPRIEDGKVSWTVAVHRDAYGLSDAANEDLLSQLRRLLADNDLNLHPSDEAHLMSCLSERSLPVEVPAVAGSEVLFSEAESEELPVRFGDELLGVPARIEDGVTYLPLSAFLVHMGRLVGTEFAVQFDFEPDCWHAVPPEDRMEAPEMNWLPTEVPPTFRGRIVSRDTGHAELTASARGRVVYVPADEIREHFPVTVIAAEDSVRVSWRELYWGAYRLALYQDAADLNQAMIPADVIMDVFGRRIVWDESQLEATFMGRVLERVVWSDADLRQPWVSLEEIAGIIGLKLQIEGRKLKLVS